MPRWLSWGLADQGLSSVTNFGLTLLAGRALGPGGLGIVFLGFAGYLLILSLHRSLIFDPMVVDTAGAGKERPLRSSYGLAITLVTGTGAALSMALIGASVPGPLGDGLLIFAPWMLPAMLQDLWRALLFRDDRGGAAAANDLSWVIGMAITLPFALSIDAPWAVVACWGTGTLIGSAYGYVQTRLTPGSLGAAWHWWRQDGWPLGRWLAAGGLLNALSLQVAVFFLASSLGSVAIGGFRAVQTVFAPMTMLGPAAALPGLPRLVRALDDSAHGARRLAAKISFLIAALTSAYVAIVWLAGSRLLVVFFGQSFEGFEELILPMSAGQLLLAGGLGFTLLLKAAKRGDSLMITRVVAAVGSVVFVPWFGLAYGLLGAAWGFVLASFLENGCIVVLALSRRFGDARRVRPPVADIERVPVPVGAGEAV